jgi:hypothetical protein
MNRTRIVGAAAILFFGTMLILTLTKKKQRNIIDTIPHFTYTDSSKPKNLSVDTAKLHDISKKLDEVGKQLDKMNGGVAEKNKKLGVDVRNDKENIDFSYKIDKDAQNNAQITIKERNKTKTVFYKSISYYFTFYKGKDYLGADHMDSEKPLAPKQSSMVKFTVPYMKGSDSIKVEIFTAYLDYDKMNEKLRKMGIK